MENDNTLTDPALMPRLYQAIGMLFIENQMLHGELAAQQAQPIEEPAEKPKE